MILITVVTLAGESHTVAPVSEKYYKEKYLARIASMRDLPSISFEVEMGDSTITRVFNPEQIEFIDIERLPESNIQ